MTSFGNLVGGQTERDSLDIHSRRDAPPRIRFIHLSLGGRSFRSRCAMMASCVVLQTTACAYTGFKPTCSTFANEPGNTILECVVLYVDNMCISLQPRIMDTTVAPEHLCDFMRLNAGCSLLGGHQGKKDSSGLEETSVATHEIKCRPDLSEEARPGNSSLSERGNFRLSGASFEEFPRDRSRGQTFSSQPRSFSCISGSGQKCTFLTRGTETCEESSIVLRLIS